MNSSGSENDRPSRSHSGCDHTCATTPGRRMGTTSTVTSSRAHSDHTAPSVVVVKNVATKRPAAITHCRGPAAVTLQSLQLFAWLEADRLAGRDRHLDAGLRVTPHAALAVADLEDAEAAQLDPFAAGERVLDRVEDGVDRLGRLDAGDVARVGDAVDDVRFDHRLLFSGRREHSKARL